MAAGPEDILQMQVMRTLKALAPDLTVFAIPNGGYRHPREAKKLKDTGTLKGVADLCVLLGQGRAGFIEMKTPTGRMSPEQKAFQMTCEIQGNPYEVCKSVDDVLATLKFWGVQFRGALS